MSVLGFDEPNEPQELLTAIHSNAAMRLLATRFNWLVFMSDVVKEVIQSYGLDLQDAIIKKVSNYIALIESTGKTHEQLVSLGRAYLDEVLEPDTRYSGC